MAEPNDQTTDLDEDLSAIARRLFAAGDVEETLQMIVDLSVDAIDGCDFAGIFTDIHNRVSTTAASDALVLDADSLQRECNEGPCLDAMGNDTTVYAEDLTTDARWPIFAPGALALGVRCTLALSLVANDIPGALNLYASEPQAFDATDRAKAAIFATLASLALGGARTHEEDDRRSDNLHKALSTRELIGQAQGILMEREHITSDHAFDILRRASQHLNVKLRDVAQDLVETGEAPYLPSDDTPRS